MSEEAKPLLATFKNVTDVDRATRAAQDIAAATGLSVRQISIDLAKALTDPTPERLSKFYIEIDGVAHSGDTSDIQGDVLTAIEAQVGGAGDNYRKAAELQRAWAELKVVTIKAFRLDRLVHWLSRQLDRLHK